jgi:hypothetical protein
MFGLFTKKSAPQHNVEQLSKVLDAVVYRMESCPLASAVLSDFSAHSESFRAAKHRYVIFVSWCARRAVISYSCGCPDQREIIELMDALIWQQFHQMLGGDDRMLELAEEAFGQFDQSLANFEADPGQATWRLGQTATSFIFAGKFDGIVPHPERLETWMMRWLLPMKVLTQIHTVAKPLVAGLR